MKKILIATLVSISLLGLTGCDTEENTNKNIGNIVVNYNDKGEILDVWKTTNRVYRNNGSIYFDIEDGIKITLSSTNYKVFYNVDKDASMWYEYQEYHKSFEELKGGK